MVVLVLVAVPIAFLNEFNHLAALLLQSGTGYLSAFEPDQLNAWTLLSLNLFDSGITVVSIFWGLWLFPFGILVYKSGFIPRLFGILLVIGCCGYVIQSLATLLFPSVPGLLTGITGIADMLGELPIILWLLIIGARNASQNYAEGTAIQK